MVVVDVGSVLVIGVIVVCAASGGGAHDVASLA